VEEKGHRRRGSVDEGGDVESLGRANWHDCGRKLPSSESGAKGHKIVVPEEDSEVIELAPEGGSVVDLTPRLPSCRGIQT
jgi:hypothetical protein